MTIIRPITWQSEPPALILLDQRALPFMTHTITCTTAEEVADAIRDMVVRGAPALSIAGAYGLVLAARQGVDLSNAYHVLLEARPTASNLRWALDRVKDRPLTEWEDAANEIYEEDIRVNKAIGDNLASHLAEINSTGDEYRDEMEWHPWSVYHHCNTGALATAGYGTALGAIRSLKRDGNLSHVWVGETRPYLQGARLTAWELHMESIHHTLIVDSAAGHLFMEGEVDVVIVGCDRVSLDGAAANKIGTLGLAIMAKYSQTPFYVCCPWSTYDPSTLRGEDIPIEERNGDEIRGWGGAKWALDSTRTYNPAFDVTKSDLITGWVTEDGVYDSPEDLHAAWLRSQE